MRVAFDSRPLADPNGVGRYARCILRALRDTAQAGDEIVETLRPAATTRTRTADLLHSPWMAGAMLRSACPTVVTLHDLAALKRPSERLRVGLRPRLRHLAVQRAASVIVPTDAVRRDAVEHLRVESERVFVIGEAADPAMFARSQREVAEVRERFALPERYMVWSGDLKHPDPSKHVAQLAAAPRELPLVLVGQTRPWAHELPNVTLTGEVSDDELAAIYSGASVLVLPSQTEGFGLPAVEALACGTPVVASDIPPLREVLGDRAVFVAPGEMHAMIEAAQSARRPAPPPLAWTWHDAARATWRVYASAAAPAVRHARPARRRGAARSRVDRLEPQ